MMRIRTMLAILVVVALVLTFAGCGTKSKLLGKWLPSEGDRAPRGFPDSIEFFSDGTVVVENLSGTYSIVDGKLRLNAIRTLVYEYSVEGTKLTLINSGKKIEYTKSSS